MDVDVVLFEGASRVGGCVQTLREQGYTMELGPDSLLLDRPATQALLQRLDLRDALIETRPEYRRAHVVRHGRLRPIPSEFRLFAPSSLAAVMRSRIFSSFGMLRAAMEPLIPPRVSTEDESVASFVRRRFGREVLDRLAQPLVGGIYCGHPERLSMQATLPQLVDMERKHGSLIRAMSTRVSARSRDLQTPRLASLRDGLQSLIDALARRLGRSVRLSSEVRALSRRNNSWCITFADGTRTQADAVICALPATAAADVLRGVDRRLAESLRHIAYSSIATVNLAYDAPTLAELPQIQGVVVPEIEDHPILAATLSTHKYPYRSPKHGFLLRAFIGGAMHPERAAWPDEQLACVAQHELARLFGIATSPAFARVKRWNRALPEYEVGHVDLVASIEARVRRYDRLALVGAAYHGAGVPACLAGGQVAADRIMDSLVRA